MGRVGAERYCLLIAKDGVIVSETYYKNTSESTYESDSLGKTITASLLGVAVQPCSMGCSILTRHSCSTACDRVATGPSRARTTSPRSQCGIF